MRLEIRKIQNAFTLIELMIVVSLIAIIAATGLPAFVNGLRKEGLRKAVSDVVEGCSHARAQAILRGVATELVIRADNGQITDRVIPSRRSEEGPEMATTTSSAEGGASQNAFTPYKGGLPDDVAVTFLYVNFQDQMESPEARVRFFPNGTSDEFTIILSSTTGEQKVSLDVITGLASVSVLR